MRYRAIALASLAASIAGCVQETGEGANDSPEVGAVDTPVVGGCCGGAGAPDPTANGLRLTIQTGVAVPLADVASSGALYLAPYAASSVSLFDGTAWVTRIATTQPWVASPGAANTNYDVFAHWDGIDVKLELAAWPSSLSFQDGVEVKNGDPSRRYVGVAGTDGAGAFVDTKTKRLVWNRDNQVARPIHGADTGSWYLTGNNTWREAHNTATSRVEVLTGGGTSGSSYGSYLSAHAAGMGIVNAPAGSNTYFGTGIGIDSSTVNSAQMVQIGQASNTWYGQAFAAYEGYLAPGRHTIRWLEIGPTGYTFYIFGKALSPPFGDNGLTGSIMM